MFYIGILSIILGLIAVLITLSFSTHFKNIRKEIKHIRNKCTPENTHINNEIINLIEKIKKDNNLTDEEIYQILNYYRKNINNEIISEEEDILAESFINFKSNVKDENDVLYTSSKFRGFDNNKYDKIKNILDYNNVKNLISLLKKYDISFENALNKINMIANMKDLSPNLKNKIIRKSTSKNKNLTCAKPSINKNLIPISKIKYCKKKLGGKIYCFRIPKKSLCPKNDITHSTKHCDFF